MVSEIILIWDKNFKGQGHWKRKCEYHYYNWLIPGGHLPRVSTAWCCRFTEKCRWVSVGKYIFHRMNFVVNCL